MENRFPEKVRDLDEPAHLAVIGAARAIEDEQSADDIFAFSQTASDGVVDLQGLDDVRMQIELAVDAAVLTLGQRHVIGVKVEVLAGETRPLLTVIEFDRSRVGGIPARRVDA